MILINSCLNFVFFRHYLWLTMSKWPRHEKKARKRRLSHRLAIGNVFFNIFHSFFITDLSSITYLGFLTKKRLVTTNTGPNESFAIVWVIGMFFFWFSFVFCITKLCFTFLLGSTMNYDGIKNGSNNDSGISLFITYLLIY